MVGGSTNRRHSSMVHFFPCSQTPSPLAARSPGAASPGLINSRYILEPAHPQYEGQMAELRRSFHEDGVLVMPDFVDPKHVPQLVTEAVSLSPVAYHNHERSNAFLRPVDQTKPKDHIEAMEGVARINVIANDQIPQDSLLRQIYDHPQLTRFIQDIVGNGPVFKYECPLGALNYQLMGDGDKIRWHYDIAEFVASIPLQKAEEGGKFEYVKDLRLLDDADFSRTKGILNGHADSAIKRLQATPGSLILFQGRNTLHSVTPIEGHKPRINCLLGYASEPHQRATPYVQEMRYGRSLQ